MVQNPQLLMSTGVQTPQASLLLSSHPQTDPVADGDVAGVVAIREDVAAAVGAGNAETALQGFEQELAVIRVREVGEAARGEIVGQHALVAGRQVREDLEAPAGARAHVMATAG